MKSQKDSQFQNTKKVLQKDGNQITSKISDIKNLKKNSKRFSNNNEYIYCPFLHDKSNISKNFIYKKASKYHNSSENISRILNPLSSKLDSSHANNNQIIYEEMKKHLFKVKKQSSPKIEAIKRYALEGEDGQNIKLKTLINQRIIMPRSKSINERSLNQKQLNNSDVIVNNQDNFYNKTKELKQKDSYPIQQIYKNNERVVLFIRDYHLKNITK